MPAAMDFEPNCAICNSPASAECNCESERMEIAVKQAQMRAMETQFADIRTWVIAHAREHITQAFERLKAVRRHEHQTYLSSLPYYPIYMQYSGHPPIHPAALSQLQSQISAAHQKLHQTINGDWKNSVMRYPEVLDYFYSLVTLRIPSDQSPSVMEPPFPSAYPEPKRKTRVSPGRRGTPSPPERRHRHKWEDERSWAMAGKGKRLSAPMPAPTPPMRGGHYGAGGYF